MANILSNPKMIGNLDVFVGTVSPVSGSTTYPELPESPPVTILVKSESAFSM